MKRILSLLTCIVLVAACVVVPVSAATDFEDGKLMELLDYKNAIESSNNIITFTKSATLNFNLPGRSLVSYVDIVFEFWGSGGGPSITSASLIRNQTEVFASLTFTKISTHLYRAFGAFDLKHFDAAGLQINVDKPNEGCSFSIESFKIGLLSGTKVVTDAKVEVYANGQNNVLTHRWDSLATYSWEVDDNDPADFSVSLYSYNNWQRFDYIDYTIGIAVREITSISVTSKGISVPFEVSEVYSSQNISDTMYMITVRVDQSSVDRSHASNFPEVAIWGNSYWDEENVIVVSSVVGHTKYIYENPISYWFKQTYNNLTNGFNNVVSNLKTGFQNVVDAIVGGSQEMDDMSDVMSQVGDDLMDAGQQFDQIESPDIDAGTLVGDYTNFSPGGLTILAAVTSNQYVTAMLVVVFTFALVGYIFFGKKG